MVRLRRPALAGLFAAGAMSNVLSVAVDGIMADSDDNPPRVTLADVADFELRAASSVVVEPAFDDVADLLTLEHLNILWEYLTLPARRLAEFVQSAKFFGLAINCKRWATRPSSLVRIKDPYTAYCLDDAAGYLLGLVESGKEPSYIHEMSEREKDEMSRRSVEAAVARCRQREG